MQAPPNSDLNGLRHFEKFSFYFVKFSCPSVFRPPRSIPDRGVPQHHCSLQRSYPFGYLRVMTEPLLIVQASTSRFKN